MKLVRYGAPGREKPGIIGDDGKIRDLSRIVKDIDGEMLASGGLAKIKKANLKRMKPVPGRPRLGPCIGNVRNFIAIALNYSDHAAEAGMPIPKEPIIFNKAPTCICGPNDDTIIPRESSKLDWEVELGIVIGKRARYLERSKAKDAIAGYFVSNDVSERVFQIERSGGQWNRGKGCESFGPIGPWFVTKDEVKDPQNLSMWLDVNGEKRQRGSTKTMIFGCEHLVWYCSQFFVMEPGDIIITGTPPGSRAALRVSPRRPRACIAVCICADCARRRRTCSRAWHHCTPSSRVPRTCRCNACVGRWRHKAKLASSASAQRTRQARGRTPRTRGWLQDASWKAPWRAALKRPGIGIGHPATAGDSGGSPLGAHC